MGNSPLEQAVGDCEKESFNPNRSLGLVVFRIFRRMNFVCLLMSDSELLRIKNKRNTSYKNRKTARSNTKILTRPNDRFGFRNVLPQKISCFAAKHFTKVTYFSQMKKRKNIKMLILSRLFHLRFRCSLKNVVIL